ncbi:hypothetical protein B0H14DRAFT_3505428 [Mycena olivaceomarginata]|nr:hypothetical protein B0H14DRAFT_3505428 [Mycena olivaceomarginata]
MSPRPCYYRINNLATPDINSPTFYCPKRGCGRRLPLNLCADGKRNAGRYYIVCFNDHHDNEPLWYFFRTGDAPRPAQSTRPRSVTIAAAPLALATSSQSGSIPQPALPPRRTSRTNQCKARETCRTSRINRLCTRQMCRSHCLNAGGCSTHHEEESPIQGETSAGDSLRILIDGLQSFVAQIPNSEQFAIREQHERAAAAHTLALRTPLPPSPTPSEEAQYHRLVARVSSPLAGPSAASTSPSLSYEILHRVVLVFWISEGCSVLVQAIQDPPHWRQSWPQIRLSDISRLLTSRAYRHLDSFYEYFCIELQSWVKISMSYILTVRTDQQLFVWRVGVVGRDQAHHLSRLSISGTSGKSISPPPALAIDVQGSPEGDDHAKIKLEPMTPPRVQLKRKAPAPAIQDEVKVKLEPATPPAKRQYLGFIDLTTPSPPSLSYSISSTSIASSSSSEFPQPLHLLSALRDRN